MFTSVRSLQTEMLHRFGKEKRIEEEVCAYSKPRVGTNLASNEAKGREAD